MLLEATLSLLIDCSFFSFPYSQSGLMNTRLNYQKRGKIPISSCFLSAIEINIFCNFGGIYFQTCYEYEHGNYTTDSEQRIFQRLLNI